MAKRKPTLICDCEDGGQHETSKQENGDTIIECAACQRFIKYPQK